MSMKHKTALFIALDAIDPPALGAALGALADAAIDEAREETIAAAIAEGIAQASEEDDAEDPILAQLTPEEIAAWKVRGSGIK